MNVTNKVYPLCSNLGVLRQARTGGHYSISTTELLAKVGWNKYQEYLPYMRHRANGTVIPESCEKWLAL